MFKYEKYLVKENDQFDPQHFLFVIDDMKIIKDETKHVSPILKSEIIVSFLKNQSLETEWLTANPELVKLVTSGSLSSKNIAALFESCRSKPVFRKQMEDFLKLGFAE
jgi:hypothetical protein